MRSLEAGKLKELSWLRGVRVGKKRKEKVPGVGCPFLSGFFALWRRKRREKRWKGKSGDGASARRSVWTALCVVCFSSGSSRRSWAR